MSEFVPVHTGDAILLTGVGSFVIRTKPANELALALDLEGKLNKLDIVDAHRFLMSAGQAAELVAEIVVMATTTESDRFCEDFRCEFNRAMADKLREAGE